ncbi:PspA/IM30 family protein [Bauldia sp.]|uniref:PspA/IM30 family protein n=1 Tax=Bauldia sp. TaxID=2575872 RepID=UPI003BAA8163
MSEALVSRVKRLVSGGVNSLVDAVENASPETVMKEAVREIDAATDQVRDELGIIVANKHLANKRLMDASVRHEELGAKIQVAMTEGRDDLAEAAIARQLDLEAQIPVLESAIKDASVEEAELEGYISALQARKREMEEELQSFRASRNTGGGDSGVAPGAQASAERKASKAEDAFNRVMSSSSGLPGMAASDRRDDAKIAELETLARKNRIRERLAALKAGDTRDA